MNPTEVPTDFLSVAEQLSRVQHSQQETYITLIKHAFQSTLSTKYPLHSIHRALQVCARSKALEYGLESVDSSQRQLDYIFEYKFVLKVSFMVWGYIIESVQI